MNKVSLTIRKRKDTKKYQAIISIKKANNWTQVQSKGGFNTKTEANTWAIPLLSEWQNKLENDYEKMTMGKLKQIYLEDQKTRVKESTHLNTINAFKLCNSLDDYILTEITPYQYRQFIKGMPYSYKVKLRAFFNFLIYQLDIKIRNPFRGIEEEAPEKEIVDYQTFIDMMDIIKHTDCQMACKIIYNTGMRIGEVCGLTIDDINKDRIDVSKQLNHATNKMSSVKSKNSVREIPITDKFYQELKEFITSKKVIGINKRIFNQKYANNALTKALTYYKKDTPYEYITFHTLRHTYITNLVISGLDLSTVAYLSGDNLNTIIKTYIHLTKKNYKIAKKFIKDEKIINI